MKNIGFVTTPLTSGHSPRGVGVYTQNLLNHLKVAGPKHNYNFIEITSSSDLSSKSFDLIHYPFFDLFYSSLPIFKNTHTIVTIHDVIPLKFPSHYPLGIKGRFNFFHQYLALKSVDRVITDSYASVKDLRQYLHLPHEKIKLIYLAVPEIYRPISDSQLLKKVSAKYHLPSDFILYVGDINYNKNIVSLIKVCLKLHIHLVMVGKNLAAIEKLDLHHPELVHLQEIVPHLSSPLIIRPGFISEEDKIALYSLATLYCQPSYYEGFGLPVLEAMACGCPVVCADVASLLEIAKSAAQYFSPDSPAQIEQAVSLVFQKLSLRTTMKKAGLIQSQKFNWTKTAADTLSVYSEFL